LASQVAATHRFIRPVSDTDRGDKDLALPGGSTLEILTTRGKAGRSWAMAAVDNLQYQHERVTVTVHGRPSAVLVAVEDLESLEETIAVLSDGNAVAALLASEAELARGEVVSQAELVEAMAKRRRSAS
jgi:antitoxin YefM